MTLKPHILASALTLSACGAAGPGNINPTTTAENPVSAVIVDVDPPAGQGRMSPKK